MTTAERAAQLMERAVALVSSSGAMGSDERHARYDDLALEINSFLEEPGVIEELDKISPGAVETLGAMYEQLVRGYLDYERWTRPIPVLAGLKSFSTSLVSPGELAVNAAEFYGGAVGDAIKEATKPAAEAFRKARPYLIAGGVLLGLLGVGYFWRSFK